MLVYAQDHLYTKYGETLKVILGEGDQLVERINCYEEGTRHLETEMGNRLSGDMWRIYERRYSYDPAGNIIKITDTGEK